MGPAPSDEELVEEKVELEGLDPTDDELRRVHARRMRMKRMMVRKLR